MEPKKIEMEIMTAGQLIKNISLLVSIAFLIIFSEQIIATVSLSYSINYKFGLLYITKEPVGRIRIHGDTIYIHTEKSKDIQLVNLERLESIIDKAYLDFPVFIKNKHKLSIKPKKKNHLSLIFITKETYAYFDETRDQKTSAFFHKTPRLIFIETSSSFDIEEEASTVRHEIFHYLTVETGLNGIIPHNSAYEFSRKKINFKKTSSH